MRIGLLGGSFNPPHLGHIHISLEAKKHCALNQIWWIPARQNPFKTINISTTPLREGKNPDQSEFLGEVKTLTDRIKNCQKITKNYPQILVKDFESKLKSRHYGQPTGARQSRNIDTVYTIDLIKKLTKQYPQHQFYWIIGADNIINFHRWKHWQQIIKLTPLIICNRDNYFHQAIKSKAFLYAQKQHRAKFLKIKKSTESSTKIRNNPHP